MSDFKPDKELTLSELTGNEPPKSNPGELRPMTQEDFSNILPEKESEPQYNGIVDEICRTTGAQIARDMAMKATELILENKDGVFDSVLEDDESSPKINSDEEAKDFFQKSSIEDTRQRKVKFNSSESTPVDNTIEEEKPIVEDRVEESPKVVKFKEEEPIVEEEVVEDIKNVHKIDYTQRMIRKYKDDSAVSDNEDMDDYLSSAESFLSDLDKLDPDKELENFKKTLKQKIKPVTEKLDLATFTINKSTVSVLNAFRNEFNERPKSSADWALYHTGTPLTTMEMRAQDIESLNPNNSSKNRYNTFMEIYRKIYDHCISPSMPSFEQFLKVVKFADVDHLYFNIFMSSFNEENLIPYTCNKCNKMDLVDVPKMSHVKYKDDNVKKEFMNMVQNPTGFVIKDYEVEILQISDAFAVALREPSVFNVVFEPLSLSDEMREKYSKILATMSYIDEIFYIDKNTKSLNPIEYKIVPSDPRETYINKIKEYVKILEELTTIQLYTLRVAISKIDDDLPVRYVIPSHKCSHCGNMIEERDESAESLLFTQHQLGAMASS